MNKRFLPAVIHTFAVVFTLCITTLSLSSCSNIEQPNTDDIFPVIQGDDSGSTTQGIEQVVQANNSFAFNLFSKYSDDPALEHANIFFSPYSISTALAMTYEGARGQTAEEIQNVFHFPEADVLRQNSAALYNQISEGGKPYTLATGNALWAQEKYAFLPEYFSTVERYYGGKVTNLDFVNAAEQSRNTINAYIEQQTRDRIRDLLSPGDITSDTRLVLTNAIYFKGDWMLQFDADQTNKADFFVTPDKKVSVDMMHVSGEEARFNYAETEEAQILELPYAGEELSMLVMLPKEGAMDAFEQSLTPQKINEWRSSLIEKRVDVSMPKFTFETKYYMRRDLSSMGMPIAFTNDADFSGMDGGGALYISSVIHQAFIEVNEEGTEAAGATAVVMFRTSLPLSKQFVANRPFVFLIQEKETGAILFMGRMSNPNKS